MAVEPNIKRYLCSQLWHLPQVVSNKVPSILPTLTTSLPAKCAASSRRCVPNALDTQGFMDTGVIYRVDLIWILTSKIPKDFKNIQVAGWLCIMKSLAKNWLFFHSLCFFRSTGGQTWNGSCIQQKVIHSLALISCVWMGWSHDGTKLRSKIYKAP